MHPSLDKLRKTFRLEHEGGYNNAAVTGGLVTMLDLWEGEARVDGIPEEIIQAVAQRLRSYDGLKPESRADSLRGLWKRIGETYPEVRSRTVPRNDQGAAPRPAPRPAKSLEGGPDRRANQNSGPRPAPPGRSESAPGAKTSATPAALNAALTVLQGVGPKHAETLGKLGLQTLGDMLYYFPRRYEDYSQLKPIKALWYGETITVIGTLQNVLTRPIRGGKSQMVEAVLSDGTGGLRLSWFNQPWMANRLKEGEQISVSGRVEQYLGRLVMNNPDWESVEVENLHTNRIVPIYALTEKITQKWLRNLMNQVVTYWAPAVPDALPESVRSSAGLLPLGQALLNIHFPSSQEKLIAARERLAFDEIFYLQMGVLRQKKDWQSVQARSFEAADDWMESRTAALPFTLTGAQQRVLSDVRADLKSGTPMNRLLQGDVGSGKTVVASLAAGIIVNANAQAAIMAPTSILAEQHYRTFTRRRRKRCAPVWPMAASRSSSARMPCSRSRSNSRTCSSRSSMNNSASVWTSAPRCAPRAAHRICWS
jgi:ATP-dependent DNA helicase RecG